MKHEFKMTAANKAFIIVTIIGPFLIIAISVLPGFLASSQETLPEGTTIAVVGADRDFYNRLTTALAATKITLTRADNLETMQEKARSGQIQGVLVIPDDYLRAETFAYYSKTGTDMLIIQTLSGVIDHTVIAARLEREGVAPQKVGALVQQPELETRKITKKGEDKPQSFFSVFGTVMTFVMLLYMTVLLYGQMISRTVLAEKTSKTVEIMLSSVRPFELLFGKIFGKGLAGILQYGIWIGVALILIYFFGPLLDIELPQELSLFNLLFLVVFFILAFFLYASAYAALGAGSQDEQHLGQLSWPLILFLVVPLVTISFYIMSPYSVFSIVLSYFPMTAPIVMLIRIIIATPPMWEIILCIGILIGTIAGFIILASKIFRVGLLMTGKRFTLKEIARWITY